jgi:hypothetical protein
MKVLPVWPRSKAAGRDSRRFPVELAHRTTHRSESLGLVLHARPLHQLQAADLVFREGHAARDNAPARVLDDQRSMMDRGMGRPNRQESRHERRRGGGAQPGRFADSQRARRRSLHPSATKAIPAIAAKSGIAGGGAPVAGSCATVGAGVGDGVVVATDGHVVGIAPAVRVTARCFEANATSAWLVDNGSGAAVCEEPGLEKPKPPFANWKVRRSLTAFFPATVQAVPVGSSPNASSAWMTAASEFGSESGDPVAYSNPPLAFCCKWK